MSKASKVPPAAKKTAQPKEFALESYVRPGLTLEEIKDIKQAFDIFDLDSSGQVDPKEFTAAFESLGVFTKRPSNKLVYQTLGEIDDDFSGGIGFDEFIKISTTKVNDKSSRAEIHKVFKMFDENKNGKVTVIELEKLSELLGEEYSRDELNAMLKKADLD